jgi:hypothetical protein
MKDPQICFNVNKNDGEIKNKIRRIPRKDKPIGWQNSRTYEGVVTHGKFSFLYFFINSFI